MILSDEKINTPAIKAAGAIKISSGVEHNSTPVFQTLYYYGQAGAGPPLNR